jgi:hypothetical protein
MYHGCSKDTIDSTALEPRECRVVWHPFEVLVADSINSSHQLIKGLTADILIHVAALAYGSPYPAYSAFSPTQASWDACVEAIIRRHVAAHRNGQSARGGSRWGDGESGDAYGR